MVKNYFKLKNLNLINFCTIFVVLIPPSLVSGPFIPDLFISIGCILFIYLCSLEKKFYYFNTNF